MTHRMKQFAITYGIVGGGPTAVILFGYLVGRNFLFSPHGGLGWLLAAFLLVCGIVCGLIYAVSRPVGQKLTTLLLVLGCLPLFFGLAFVLIVCMPDAWNHWIFPNYVAR
jgi:hypothetical protein